MEAVCHEEFTSVGATTVRMIFDESVLLEEVFVCSFVVVHNVNGLFVMVSQSVKNGFS